MSDALLILSIGPVQGFIAQARRAADLYAGSQLLTKLVDAAIDVIGEGNVLYPRRVKSEHPQSLPNKLIACVPTEQAVEIARQAEKQIRENWQKMAGPVREKLARYAPPDEEWQKMWTAQLAQLPEIYWTVTPWEEGQLYEQVYSRAGRDFDARKRLRNFDAIEERGRKCTVCGERAALHRKGETTCDYWAAVARKVGEAKLRPDGKEQLCAICAVKRFGELGQEHFPSVSEMAAVPFKQTILQQFEKSSADMRLIEVLQSYTGIQTAWNAPAIPLGVIHTLTTKRVADAWKKVVEQFLRYDGEWLFLETYERKLAEIKQTSTSEQEKCKKIKQAKEAVQKLLQITRDLELTPHRPCPYYAVLMADGDRMGKQIRKAAAEGPDKHRAISQALAKFASEEVYRIIEEKHAGRVVYAGGDDVLALLPLPNALAAAEDLRQAYAEKMDGLLESPTMSASIAIAHHLSPLSEVLQAARQAEHVAKEEYGRNAIAVTFLKRGGVPITMGAGWEFGNDSETTIKLLLDIQQRFSATSDNNQKEKGLSLGLAHTLLDEGRFLGGDVPEEARQAEVERLLYRAAPARLPKEVRQRQAQDLAPRLVQLATSIERRRREAQERHRHESCLSVSSAETEPGLVTVAHWLLLLRFIVQESGAPVVIEGEG